MVHASVICTVPHLRYTPHTVYGSPDALFVWEFSRTLHSRGFLVSCSWDRFNLVARAGSSRLRSWTGAHRDRSSAPAGLYPFARTSFTPAFSGITAPLDRVLDAHHRLHGFSLLPPGFCTTCAHLFLHMDAMRDPAACAWDLRIGFCTHHYSRVHTRLDYHCLPAHATTSASFAARCCTDRFATCLGLPATCARDTFATSILHGYCTLVTATHCTSVPLLLGSLGYTALRSFLVYVFCCTPAHIFLHLPLQFGLHWICTFSLGRQFRLHAVTHCNSIRPHVTTISRFHGCSRLILTDFTHHTHVPRCTVTPPTGPLRGGDYLHRFCSRTVTPLGYCGHVLASGAPLRVAYLPFDRLVTGCGGTKVHHTSGFLDATPHTSAPALGSGGAPLFGCRLEVATASALLLWTGHGFLCTLHWDYSHSLHSFHLHSRSLIPDLLGCGPTPCAFPFLWIPPGFHCTCISTALQWMPHLHTACTTACGFLKFCSRHVTVLDYQDPSSLFFYSFCLEFR